MPQNGHPSQRPARGGDEEGAAPQLARLQVTVLGALSDVSSFPFRVANAERGAGRVPVYRKRKKEERKGCVGGLGDVVFPCEEGLFALLAAASLKACLLPLSP